MEEVTVDEHERWSWAAQRYPHQNDPRRNPDFSVRRTDANICDLLGAILDELYKINDRAVSSAGAPNND